MNTHPFFRHFFTFLFTLSLALIFSSATQAHEFKLGDFQITHPFARATVPQQKSGGAFLDIENKGKMNDKLIKAESSIAKSVEIHSMKMVGDVMKMREVDHIDLNAGNKICMKPGGEFHIMLIGLNQQLKAGEQFPLTLYFEKAGKIDVTVKVEASGN